MVFSRYYFFVDQRRTYELLERIGSLLRSEERRSGGRHGLQPTQIHALAFLDQANRYSDSPASVTEYLGLTKGTASQTLQRLVEKGFLRQESDRKDGRRVHLKVTAAGRRVLRDIRPPDSFEKACQGVGTGPLEASLSDLLTALQREQKQKPFGICRTCRHFRRGARGSSHQCGLTLEPLREEESSRLCREHEWDTERHPAPRR